MKTSLPNALTVIALLLIPLLSFGQASNLGASSSSAHFTVADNALISGGIEGAESLQDTCLIKGDSFICPGRPVQLCAPALADAYLWSTGDTTRCLYVSLPGTYSVTVTFVGGLVSTCSKTVTLNEVTACEITGNTVICPGQTTKLCAGLSGASDYWWITGAQTQCIDVTTAGTYSVTITDANGCKSECTKIVTLSGPDTCLITETVICPGQTTKLCADLAGASDYWWITGAQTQCIDVTTAGTYSVTVTDANGCKSECTKIVTMGETANCQITETVICPGQTTKLCADLSGASDYWWITGAQTQCIDVTTAGTYSITITDANGCKSECTKIVTMGETANCQITGPDVICPGQTAKLCVPAGASDYWWITGAQTQCIDVTTAGTYSITITDANGCKSECTKIVTMSEGAACQITGDEVIRPGQSTQLCVSSGALTYLWSNGATTNCITVNATGTYSVTATYAGGCTSVCSKTVAIVSEINCIITGNDFICPGRLAQLCGPALAEAYLWSTGDTTRCIHVSSAGTYSVTVTYVGGLVRTCIKTIGVNEDTTCEITGDTLLCLGKTTRLCAPEGAIDYWWSTGEQTRCIDVAALGTYSLTLTTSGGCVSYCSKIVIRCPSPLNISEKSIVEKQVNQSDGHIQVRIYPNPIYAKTMVEFQNTDSNAHVLIDIYTSTGSKVATVFNGEVEKNVQYNTEWNAENLAGGIYYCRIVNGRQITYKKLILIK